MRVLLSLLLAIPIALSAQLCSEPSPVSYSGFGSQLTQADLSTTEEYLDGLNTANFSLGTGVSDNNLCIQSNSDITTFLGVKLRNTTAPNDNTAASGNAYFVEPGYSPDSQNGAAGAGPYAKWNIIAYAGLNAGAFDSVDVIVHLDFDPCFGYVEEDLLAINIGDELDNNILTSSANVSSFGINTNLAYASIEALNNTSTPFDATTEGYYTFAIEIKDNCGNRKLWNEITVYVQSETTAEGDLVADANGNGVYDDNEVVGCQNEAACNFDCTATTDGGCDYVSCSGCTVQEACNYNSSATIANTAACNYPVDLWGADHYNCDGSCVSDVDQDGICDEDEISGCKDDSACNYDDTVTTDADNTLCTYANANADCNGDCLSGYTNVNGSCVAIVSGCTDDEACNYDGASANTDDGSCEYTSCGACLNEDACNFNNGSGLIHNSTLCDFATEACDTCSGATNGTGSVVNGDTDADGICDSTDNCIDTAACNYADNSNLACTYVLTYYTDTDGDGIGEISAGDFCAGSEPAGSVTTVGDLCLKSELQNGYEPCNWDGSSTNTACEWESCKGCMVNFNETLQLFSCTYDASYSIPDASDCEYPGDACNDTDSGTVNDTFDANCDCVGETIVSGCTDLSAFNYNSAANVDDSSCVAVTYGCLEASACNFNESANTTDGSCTYAATYYDCSDNCVNDSDEDGVCDELEVVGCMNSGACNFDVNATDAGTCNIPGTCDSCATDDSGTVISGDTNNNGICDNVEVSGCTTTNDSNYDPTANVHDDDACAGTIAGSGCNYCATFDSEGNCLDSWGCNYAPYETADLSACGDPCPGDAPASPLPLGMVTTCQLPWACNFLAEGDCDFTSCVGCMNDDACNFSLDFTVDSPATCDFDCWGCTDNTADNYDSSATDDDGSCTYTGCMDAGACNYNALATTDDASCEYASCAGCLIPSACNYDVTWTINDPASCTYAASGYDCSGGCINDSDLDGVCDEFEIAGCQDNTACNYDATATDAGDCTYPAAYYDCDGECLADADNDGVCDDLEIPGCTDVNACDYDSTATDDTGCDYTSCVGCLNTEACNYDASITQNAPALCLFPESGEDCSGNCLNDADLDGVCDENEVDGCIDASACNYNASATNSDDSCTYASAGLDCSGACLNDVDNDGTCDENEISGCMIANACNYDSTATDNAGCDFTSCEGCMDNTACNYDDEATTNVPSQCLYPSDLYGASHFDCDGACLNDTDGDGTCDEDEVAGCTDSGACNYNSAATDSDGSCTYPSESYLDCNGDCLTDEDEDGVCDEIEVFGCDDDDACNFNPAATENDGSCEYETCAGCTIESACNYDATATLSNNVTCTYIPEGWDDCDATICTDSDNDGNCDFDEPTGCVGEFNAPVISLSGMVETAADIAEWATTDFLTGASDDTGMEGTSFSDYAGRLNDGRYSVTRVYVATDICGNTSEAGQLIVADASHAAGCTNPNATSYDADAINDDGSCDYSPACLGDLNLDSIVGTSDLLILLSSFGLPCAD